MNDFSPFPIWISSDTASSLLSSVYNVSRKKLIRITVHVIEINFPLNTIKNTKFLCYFIVFRRLLLPFVFVFWDCKFKFLVKIHFRNHFWRQYNFIVVLSWQPQGSFSTHFNNIIKNMEKKIALQIESKR